MGSRALWSRHDRLPDPRTSWSTAGAGIARQFLNAGLLDEIRLHFVPVILGTGTRLFDGVRPDLRVTRRDAQHSPGVTHLTYDLERPATDS